MGRVRRQKIFLCDHQRIKPRLPESFHSSRISQTTFKAEFSPLTFGPHLCHLLHSFPLTWWCVYCLSLYVLGLFSFPNQVTRFSLETARPVRKEKRRDSCWRIFNFTMLHREKSTLQKVIENYFSKRCLLMVSLEYLGAFPISVP